MGETLQNGMPHKPLRSLDFGQALFRKEIVQTPAHASE